VKIDRTRWSNLTKLRRVAGGCQSSLHGLAESDDHLADARDEYCSVTEYLSDCARLLCAYRRDDRFSAPQCGRSFSPDHLVDDNRTAVRLGLRRVLPGLTRRNHRRRMVARTILGQYVSPSLASRSASFPTMFARRLSGYKSATRPLSTNHERSNRTFCSMRRSCVTSSSAPS
jgi:hypothetical protein